MGSVPPEWWENAFTWGYNPVGFAQRRGVVDVDFQVGAWLVRPSLNTVSQKGTTRQLEPKVMEVLVCLAQHSGETLSKEQLLKTVWPDTFVSDDVLIRSVSELRRVLEDAAREPKFIQTIPKRGYRLVAPVTAVNGTKAAPLPEAAKPRDTTGRPHRALWTLTLLGAGLLITLLAAFKFPGLRDRLFRRSDMPAIHSLAVLPFKNLSDDPAQKYFAYGMAEELITDLSQMSGLKVISHTSANRYQDTDKSVPQVARELAVDAVVEGAVQRSGDRVRVTAQLIYAPQDSNLWARTYDGDLRDVLALQSTLAREIADEIRVKMTPQETARLTKPRPVNPKALEAYWKGQYHLSLLQRGEYVQGWEQFARREIRDALSNFEQAIQIDPSYAQAYLGYSDAVGEFRDKWDPHTELTSKGKWALMKALELDDTLARAHLALADDYFARQWNWTSAEKEYKRAIELDPNSAWAHGDYAAFLDSMGKLQEGLKHHQLQVQLEPDYDGIAASPLMPLDLQIEQVQRFLETHNSALPEVYWTLYLLLARAGRYKEAIDEAVSELTRLGWTDSVEAVRRGYAIGGYQNALREWAKSLEAKWKHEYFPPNMLAYLYGVLGDKDRAFAWMEKAYEIHEGSIASMKVNLDYEPLRSDPRFAEMLRRVGLPE